MTRLPGVLPALLLLPVIAGCGGDGPARPVFEAVREARAGDGEGFLTCFTPRSGALLGMFFSVSRRYGYVPEDALQFLSEVETVRERVQGDRAEVVVRTGEREGILCVRRENGRWLIDLEAGGECLGAPAGATGEGEIP